MSEWRVQKRTWSSEIVNSKLRMLYSCPGKTRVELCSADSDMSDAYCSNAIAIHTATATPTENGLVCTHPSTATGMYYSVCIHPQQVPLFYRGGLATEACALNEGAMVGRNASVHNAKDLERSRCRCRAGVHTCKSPKHARTE